MSSWEDAWEKWKRSEKTPVVCYRGEPVQEFIPRLEKELEEAKETIFRAKELVRFYQEETLRNSGDICETIKESAMAEKIEQLEKELAEATASADRWHEFSVKAMEERNRANKENAELRKERDELKLKIEIVKEFAWNQVDEIADKQFTQQPELPVVTMDLINRFLTFPAAGFAWSNSNIIEHYPNADELLWVLKQVLTKHKAIKLVLKDSP